MLNPDIQQVFELSDYFHQLGNAIGEYIQQNKNFLENDERNYLYDKQIELLQFAGRINIIGVTLVFDDVQDALKQMNKITADVQKTIKKVLAVQQAIDIATTLVGIGTAIISRDPKLFAKNCGRATSLINAINDKKI